MLTALSPIPHPSPFQAVGYVNTAAVKALVEFDESLAKDKASSIIYIDPSDVDRVMQWTAKDFAEEHRFADIESVLGNFANASSTSVRTFG